MPIICFFSVVFHNKKDGIILIMVFYAPFSPLFAAFCCYFINKELMRLFHLYIYSNNSYFIGIGWMFSIISIQHTIVLPENAWLSFY
jgi:hypothetical protein